MPEKEAFYLTAYGRGPDSLNGTSVKYLFSLCFAGKCTCPIHLAQRSCTSFRHHHGNVIKIYVFCFLFSLFLFPAFVIFRVGDLRFSGWGLRRALSSGM
jgi:hypothetical protein